jgi:hypothetical protein
MNDYGAAWRITRPASITDLIYIKALRVRAIEKKGVMKINEGVKPELVGIINYAIMGIIQIENDDSVKLEPDKIIELYKARATDARNLMLDKNHDYDEAWRVMRPSSITDMILMKILRVKQIEDNHGATTISEGIPANYLDIINYAAFAIIRLEEKNIH